MRILIVADERALCDTLVKSLKQKGYEVDACYDGDSALDWLLTEKYDLLLLDLNLPGRDGMDLLKTLREQTDRLSKMVRTLLDMSDLKAVPRTDKIQLAPMIEEVLADLSPLAEKSGVALSQSGEDLWITGSDVLVYRSIFNLVENGVKYNHPGGSVRVAASRRGSSAVIEVRDTGCGIPENFRESVFQPFFRVDKSRSREKGGVGLGLSLVWEIAHLHGGSVRITESGKDGTVIELTLPISAEEQGIPCG